MVFSINSIINFSLYNTLTSCFIPLNCKHKKDCTLLLTLKLPEMKVHEFSSSLDQAEMVHKEPPYMALHCLHLIL